VLLTIVPSTEPYVRGEPRVAVEWLSEGLVRVTASFGFGETRRRGSDVER
jgi:K+ transporter